jgi:hypothetical protein
VHVLASRMSPLEAGSGLTMKAGFRLSISSRRGSLRYGSPQSFVSETLVSGVADSRAGLRDCIDRTVVAYGDSSVLISDDGRSRQGVFVTASRMQRL